MLFCHSSLGSAPRSSPACDEWDPLAAAPESIQNWERTRITSQLRALLIESAPNNRLQATADSLRSSLSSAIGGA